MRDVAVDLGGTHERLSSMITPALLEQVLDDVPDVWLQPAEGIDDPPAARAAYADNLLARLEAPSAWQPRDQR